MENIKAARSDKDKSFSYMHKWTAHPKSNEFALHTHTDYEIYIFISGDARFVVEGKSYRLMPYDMLLIRGNELHRIFPEEETAYERIVLNITDSFFDAWNCQSLRAIFKADMESRYIRDIKEKRIYDILMRAERYISATTKQDDAVVKCAIVEFLYNISKLSSTVVPSVQNDTASGIISYINQNLAQPISLDFLAEKFFLSKFYMCRIFKKNTGFTINQYITAKRLLLAKKLCKDGMAIGNACLAAGFGSYSDFYRAYVKAFGTSPRSDILRF